MVPFKMKGPSLLKMTSALKEEQQSSDDPGPKTEQKGELAKLYEMLAAATTPAIKESIQMKIDAILAQQG